MRLAALDAHTTRTSAAEETGRTIEEMAFDTRARISVSIVWTMPMGDVLCYVIRHAHRRGRWPIEGPGSSLVRPSVRGGMPFPQRARDGRVRERLCRLRQAGDAAE